MLTPPMHPAPVYSGPMNPTVITPNGPTVFTPGTTYPTYNPGTGTVIPPSTPSYTPAPGTVITPSTPTYTPAPGTVFTPTTPTYTPAPGTIITPNTPTYTPGTPTYNPGTPIYHPGTMITPGVPTMDPARRVPLEGLKRGAMNSTGTEVLTPAGAKIETEGTNPFDLARRYELRVARATDYSKLTGQLFFVHTDGGLWVLRYAPLSEEDLYGGSVVLARDRMMTSYRQGDLVTVEGQIISQKSSARLGGPLYRVSAISLVDRPQQ